MELFNQNSTHPMAIRGLAAYLYGINLVNNPFDLSSESAQFNQYGQFLTWYWVTDIHCMPIEKRWWTLL
jgi:hypothetical protein